MQEARAALALKHPRSRRGEARQRARTAEHPRGDPEDKPREADEDEAGDQLLSTRRQEQIEQQGERTSASPRQTSSRVRNSSPPKLRKGISSRRRGGAVAEHRFDQREPSAMISM